MRLSRPVRRLLAIAVDSPAGGMLGKALGSRWKRGNAGHCVPNKDTYQLAVGTGCKCVPKLEAEAQRLDAIFRRTESVPAGAPAWPELDRGGLRTGQSQGRQQALVMFVWVGLDFDMGN